MDPDARRDAALEQRCAGCGTSFRCGAGSGQECWCTALPSLPIARYAPGLSCLCPQCLKQAIEQAASA